MVKEMRIGESAAKLLRAVERQARQNVQRLRPHQPVPVSNWEMGSVVRMDADIAKI